MCPSATHPDKTKIHTVYGCVQKPNEVVRAVLSPDRQYVLLVSDIKGVSNSRGMVCMVSPNASNCRSFGTAPWRTIKYSTYPRLRKCAKRSLANLVLITRLVHQQQLNYGPSTQRQGGLVLAGRPVGTERIAACVRI